MDLLRRSLIIRLTNNSLLIQPNVTYRARIFRSFAVLSALIFCLLPTLPTTAAPNASHDNPPVSVPNWIDPPTTANAGYFSLAWRFAGSGSDIAFELQEADTRAFANPRVIYRGSDTGTTISGKPDGPLYYRVRLNALETETRISGWSETQLVTVKHHSLNRALIFLLIGAVVFLATAALILRGDRNSRGESRAKDEEDGETA